MTGHIITIRQAGSLMSNDNSLKSTGGSQTIGELLSCTKALMQKGEFAEVEKLMLPLLQENPNQEEGWYFLGVSQRYLKKYQAALDSLDNLRTIILAMVAPGRSGDTYILLWATSSRLVMPISKRLHLTAP